MEQILDAVWGQLTQYLSIYYLLSVIFVSYLVKKHLGDFLAVLTRTRWKPVYTVLVIATLLAFPFIIATDEGWEKILLSYTVATSLYELIFEWIESRLMKKPPQ